MRKKKDWLKIAILSALHQTIEMTGAQQNSQNSHDFIPKLKICNSETAQKKFGVRPALRRHLRF